MVHVQQGPRQLTSGRYCACLPFYRIHHCVGGLCRSIPLVQALGNLLRQVLRFCHVIESAHILIGSSAHPVELAPRCLPKRPGDLWHPWFALTRPVTLSSVCRSTRAPCSIWRQPCRAKLLQQSRLRRHAGRRWRRRRIYRPSRFARVQPRQRQSVRGQRWGDDIRSRYRRDPRLDGARAADQCPRPADRA